MQLRNYSHEKVKDGDCECCTAAPLVLCSTALVLMQDSGVHCAGIAGGERVKAVPMLISLAFTVVSCPFKVNCQLVLFFSPSST